jgi:hypothetical protein
MQLMGSLSYSLNPNLSYFEFSPQLTSDLSSPARGRKAYGEWRYSSTHKVGPQMDEWYSSTHYVGPQMDEWYSSTH